MPLFGAPTRQSERNGAATRWIGNLGRAVHGDPEGEGPEGEGPLNAELVWPYWRAMVRSAYGVLGSRDEAEDCAAEALTQILERPPLGVRNPEAFLVTVARRRAIDHRRASRSARKRVLRAGVAHAIDEADVAVAVADQREAAWADQQARSLLGPAAYQLLQMIADGVSIDQAAAAMGITTRAAESRLLRARRVMRAALASAVAMVSAVLAGIRRGWTTVSPVFTMAAVAALVVGLPTFQGPSTPDPRDTQVTDRSSAVSSDAPGTAPGVVEGATAGNTSGPTRPSWVQPAAKPVLTPEVRTPAGGARVYQVDDGYEPAGPADVVMHCLQNLDIGLHHQGCEGSPSSTPQP